MQVDPQFAATPDEVCVGHKLVHIKAPPAFLQASPAKVLVQAVVAPQSFGQFFAVSPLAASQE